MTQVRGVGRLLLFVALTSIVTAGVCVAADDQQPAGQKPADAQPEEKPPAPPLFPRHHRGIYTDRDHLDAVDATPQSPPLETDDPGVPDKGEYEINLTASGELSSESQHVDLLLVDANYGLMLKIGSRGMPAQAKVEFPVTAAREQREPFILGVGPVELGLKLNFYTSEDIGLSMSVYPQIELRSSGDEEEPGPRLVMPFLVEKEFKYCTAVANAGVNSSWHRLGSDGFDFFGAGLGRAVTRKLAAMAELHAETPLDLHGVRELTLNGGVIYGVRHVVMYASVGHSLISDEDIGFTQVAVGLKLLVQSRGQSTR